MKLSMQFDIFLYSEYRTEQAVIYWCIKLMLNCRVSPERLFLDLALGKSDASITDNLGISLGLDINTLYELSAENCVQNHSYERAIKLFKMAKVIASNNWNWKMNIFTRVLQIILKVGKHEF